MSSKPTHYSKMSSKDGEKRNATAATASGPSIKRQKTESIVQSNRSLLLDAQPEILRKVYSFLSLKEALVLRQVYRRFNGAANDLCQHSVIMNKDALKRLGFTHTGNSSILSYTYISKNMHSVILSTTKTCAQCSVTKLCLVNWNGISCTSSSIVQTQTMAQLHPSFSKMDVVMWEFLS